MISLNLKKRSLRKGLFIIPAFLAIIAVFSFVAITRPTPVAAASLANWNPNQIIDDTLFTNSNMLNVSQIQAFLNSKVSNCDTNGTQPASDFGRSDLTHAQYAASRGWSAPPYTCLKDYTENGLGSAQIIYNLSQQYSINPEVLIVLLQKEQGLVTDSWPLATEYKSATGYGCPDSAACDSQYYGFTNQLNNAAKMFHAIMTNNPNWYTPIPLGSYPVLYNPNTSCGSSVLNIQNRSTQALYNYTPYQPNQAALNAGYGAGDSCSSYGNRNFYEYFTDWFGSTGTPFATNNNTVAVYTDSSLAQSASTSTLTSGQRIYVVMRFRNNGSATWNNSGPGTVRLAVMGASPSAFCDDSWVNCSRPVTMQESTVGPGGTATFGFWYKAPTVNNTADYSTTFGVVAEGVATMLGDQPTLLTRVNPLTYATNNASVAVYTDSSLSQQSNSLTNVMTPQQRVYVVMKFRNNGSAIWSNTGNAAVRLAIMGNNPNAFKDSDSTSDYRVVTMQESTVGPGGTATFGFWYKAPVVAGMSDYATQFGLVSEGVATMLGDQPTIYTRVMPWSYAVNNSTVSAYTDASKSTPTSVSNLSSGQRVYVVMTFRNNGSALWSNTGSYPVMLALMSNNPSVFKDPSWINDYRATTMQESTVGPGGTATFGFWYKAPTVTSPTPYATKFGLVSETIATMLGDQPTISSVVNP